MKKAVSTILLIGTLLLVIGAGLFLLALAMNGWDFRALDNSQYQTKSYEITDEFSKISIDTTTADVLVLPGTDAHAKVISYERVRESNEVKVMDGTLSIGLCDTRKWYDHIRLFSFTEPTLTVYLPEEEYESLCISLTTGDICVASALTFGEIRIDGTTGDIEEMANATEALQIHLTTGDMKLQRVDAGEIAIENTTGDIELNQIGCSGALTIKTTTGDIELSDTSASALHIKGTTGEVDLVRVTVSNALTLKSTTGDVSFRALNAASIDIDISTGNVYGSVVRAMNFSASATTGNVRVPSSREGGLCLVKTTTGDITITVEE